MKKITYPIISIIVLIFINACAGYKPVYTTDLQFKIADYSIKSNKKLGRQIYSKLYNLSKFSRNNPEVLSVKIAVDTTKDKISMLFFCSIVVLMNFLMSFFNPWFSPYNKKKLYFEKFDLFFCTS